MDFPTLIEIPTLDYTAIQKANPGEYGMDYDRDLDTLFIYRGAKPNLAACHYLEDGVYALYDPTTLQVFGFQIEEFERLFIVRYAAIGDAWRRSPLFWRTRTRKEVIQALLTTITNFLPPQGTNKPMRPHFLPA
ncbi:MAG: hypothetical protein DRN08_07660 [Thermoplasmata archaeon]|nr:MAG: hypothetical protein DRN08_07660 [Thermoplasmata archaeon]